MRVLVLLLLLSGSLYGTTPTPTFTPTPWYSFKAETFSTGMLLTSTTVSDTTEGYWTAHPYDGESITADIQTAGWSSNALRIAGSNATVRSSVGNTRTSWSRANGLSMTARCGSGDRHAFFMMWNGVHSFDSHPEYGYVSQSRSSGLQ